MGMVHASDDGKPLPGDVILAPSAADIGRLLSLFSGGAVTPAMVESAEQAMLAYPQVACPVIHRFAPGQYLREVRMPADTFAIGHHQNFAHVNIFLRGRVTVFKEDGSAEELVAPMLFVGAPGRKVGYVHEEVVWLNSYATDETDIEKLEATLLTKSPTWQIHAEIRKTMAQFAAEVDRADFAAAIAELGFTEAVVRAQSEDPADQVGMPYGNYKMKVSPSPIEGRGVFATADIAAGEIIAPARINGMRTPAGRFTNHAKTPNARMEIANPRGDVNLVAQRAIKGCHGGADGEEITVDYRQSANEVVNFQIKEQACQA